MSRWQRVLAAVAAVAALVCGLAVVEFTMPAPAHASSTEVSMLMDDDQLIYSSPEHTVQTLQTLSSRGVDVVKVSMVWQLVAPNAYSTLRPHFDATNPAAYLGWTPSTSEYQQFVKAIGRRYGGGYPDPIHGTTIPRVDYWGIWNEPNERSWLSPWYQTLSGHRRALIQPSRYRSLVDAAWRALAITGHSHDNVMVGETANRGIWSPAAFARALYCVGRTSDR